ncbi:hypothetical protein LPJ53_003224 [Coemansia erecta]|uniref:Uncharacterized protein n=1 Tax=Coemansia erecta TaxID=147472 RepID=A0A9W7XWN7_9FUNG|nr:hypothetical protein LPJ53_003224 [Coemansia erecta]
MADRKPVLDWALQFYCSLGDDEMVDDLVRLRRFEIKDADDSRPPLSLAFHRLRRGIDGIGPSCLGFGDSEISLSESQPWASPLVLPKLTARAADNPAADPSAQRPEHFLPPTELYERPSATTKRHSSNPKSPATRVAQQNIDIPAVIRLLITAETARRRIAAEYLLKRQSQGSVADQSERWQHHFAKRNLAEETQFENVLVALKELAVLQAIIDPTTEQSEDLARCLEHTGGRPVAGAKRRRRQTLGAANGGGFDAAQCLAILNLMFPLDPQQHADGRPADDGTAEWSQRYAFRLQHVPSPRMQLVQLLCEVEAWVGSHASDGRPSKCPRWTESARGFAWAQLRQSGLSYVVRAEKKVLELHRKLHPWAFENAAPEGAVSGEDGVQAHFDAAIARDNAVIVAEIDGQVAPDATVIERIARHSQLVRHRFSALAVRDALRKER